MEHLTDPPGFTPLPEYCRRVATLARDAAEELVAVATKVKNDWLLAGAASIRAAHEGLLEANQQDVVAAHDFGLTSAQTDRLVLTCDRIEAIACGLEQIAALPDPIGTTLAANTRPNGLQIRKIRVPLGVVFFIYESRPNVTADAAAICVKSGNAVILRGGKEAAHSSTAIVQILRQVGNEHGLPPNSVQLVGTPDRAAVGHFLALPELIDLAIPRGGESLIRRVAEEAQMPVLKHFSGNCHVYVDASANLEMAKSLVVNSKCQRLGVCNAAESLLVHQKIAHQFLPDVAALRQHDIELRGDPMTCDIVPTANAISAADFTTEYLGPIISVCVVDDVEAAIAHINRYGSGHTDAIVGEDQSVMQQFATRVDSAAVMLNASTRFNDGSEFGMGAEIGISTDKIHARGPCGLNELTSYKYVVRGTGQVRE